MKKDIIGTDISKDKLDFCILEAEKVEVKQRGVLTNDQKSIKKWLKQYDNKNVVFALEHTGHYGATLAHCLTECGFKYYLINPLTLKRSLGIQRGKTDKKDAYRIADYTLRHQHKMKAYELPTENLRKLKALITARERYVKISVQIQNSIKANKILNKTVDVKTLIKEEEKRLKNISEAIHNIEKEMKTIIESDISLNKSYKKITRVIGVGPITASKCIIETDNFLKFRNGRKFSCHCGLAPFAYESGSSVKGKTKTHYLRDRPLKAIMIRSAITAIQHDPQLKKYYQRKLKEGKNEMAVKNAVANKLVLRIFAVVKREEPFVKMSA